MLMETTLRSCPRLTPVIDLVTQIRAHLQYVEPSWLHMLTTIPKIRSKLTHVELDGIYMTKGIDRTLLRTPHWGTPFSTASSSPLAHLTEIWLHHIHFDQFSDLARLLRHFVFPNSISMDKLTWGKTDVPLHWPPRSVHGKRSTGIKYISIKDCTDDTLAAIAIHALDARLPIQTLLPHEQLQVQELSQAMHKDLDRRLNTCPVLAPFPSELLGRLLITCSCPEPHKKTQVVGALLILPKTGDIRRFERTALSGFLDSVIKFPGLRAIGVAYFGSPDEPFFSLPEVSASVSGLRPDVVCRLLHSRGQYASELPVWIELEWATKKPTGML
ncbi:hypothetical protein BDW22DRAFT_624582 [Trametopsis cervina]|nr:hypothetical protein BDW22DRAFT_624582 [Trametopsis cervina]